MASAGRRAGQHPASLTPLEREQEAFVLREPIPSRHNDLEAQTALQSSRSSACVDGETVARENRDALSLIAPEGAGNVLARRTETSDRVGVQPVQGVQVGVEDFQHFGGRLHRRGSRRQSGRWSGGWRRLFVRVAYCGFDRVQPLSKIGAARIAPDPFSQD